MINGPTCQHLICLSKQGKSNDSNDYDDSHLQKSTRQPLEFHVLHLVRSSCVGCEYSFAHLVELCLHVFWQLLTHDAVTVGEQPALGFSYLLGECASGRNAQRSYVMITLSLPKRSAHS